tara:strand:+ start:7814 stop:11497 length:3684 start_codon:yes stop_codon:yes gene_type:complete
MRILVDIQGCQTEGSRNRGIGRYSKQLIKDLIINFPDNEYILFANPYLYDLRSEFKNELSNKLLNVFYFQLYSPFLARNKSNSINDRDCIAVLLRSYAVSNLLPDIILITSAFEGFNDDAVVEFSDVFNLPPISTILYDLIPLIQSDLYFRNNPLYESFYKKRINYLLNIDSFLAISSSASRELKDNLPINQNKIYTISSACDTNLFQPTQDKFLIEKNRKKPLEKYILYSGAADPRKNLATLIKAYSKLPTRLILDYKLVLAGKYLPEEVSLIEESISTNSLNRKNILLTGFVSDNELVSLYSHCSLFVFPSLHEGFGLPVLEAMSCGAPVIASNNTSIPEIIGLNDALFDPLNSNEISKLIEKSLTDVGFRNRLILNSKNNHKNFSWRKTATKTMDGLIKTAISLDLNHSQINNRILSNRENLISILSNRILDHLPINNHPSLIEQISSALYLIDNQISNYFKVNSGISGILQWQIEGPFDTNYSLAILNRNIAIAFNSLDVDISIFSTEGLGDFEPSNDFLSKNQLINKLFLKSKDKTRTPSVISRNLYPPRVNDISAKIRLLHSYGWEESQFPDDWVDEFNYHLNGISVMSEYVKNILISNGVSIPIAITGLGLDHFSEVNNIPKLNLEVKDFVFLHISSCFPRKGIDILIDSYLQAFNSEDNVSLVIKTFRNIHHNVKEKVQQILLDNQQSPHILVIEDEYSDSEILSLYKIANVLVAPSFGEGFGLPIGEAMLNGLPVITTAFGGQIDFCNENNSWLIDFKYRYANSHFGLTSSVWAEPSKTHLTQLLQQIYTAKKEDILLKTTAALKSVKLYTWENVAKKNIYFVNKLSELSNHHTTRVGWISTWNSRCGIASYSKYLLKNITDFKQIFAPYEEKLEHLDEAYVTRCWDMKSNSSFNYDLLLNQVYKYQITTIVIQLNFSFFEFFEFYNFIKDLKKNKVNVIIFIHSTIAPDNFDNTYLEQLYKAFAIADRLLVHTPSDMNRLKSVKLDKNAILFPHGIIDPIHLNNNKFNNYSKFKSFISKKSLKFKLRSLHLATYGFLLPNKGFLELIESISLLRNENINVKLTMITSLYSIDDHSFLNELNSKINEYNMGEFVSIISDYLNDEDSLSLLSKSDLVVLPYQSTNESSSASVRHCIASGVPVAITPNNIFEDIQGITYVLPGITPELIKIGIKKYFFDKRDDCQEDDIYRINWLKQHSYTRLSVRLQGLIKGLEIRDDY